MYSQKNKIDVAAAFERAMCGLINSSSGGGAKMKLKMARQILGVSQADLATIFGLQVDTVKGWEARSRPEPTGVAAVFIDLLAADPGAMLDLALKRKNPAVVADLELQEA